MKNSLPALGLWLRLNGGYQTATRADVEEDISSLFPPFDVRNNRILYQFFLIRNRIQHVYVNLAL